MCEWVECEGWCVCEWVECEGCVGVSHNDLLAPDLVNVKLG